MVIIPFQTGHKSRLLEIFKDNTPKYFAPAEQSDFETYLSEHGNTYYIIKSMGTIAGGGGYHKTDYVGRLSWTMLDPNFHSQGLGRALINFCIEQMLKSNLITQIEVRTSQHAKGFYSKFGFSIVEHKKDFWGTGHDLFRMQRPS